MDQPERVNDLVNSGNVFTCEAKLRFKRDFRSGFESSVKSWSFLSLQLQEIFRKKNEKKGRKGDAEKSAQLVRKLLHMEQVSLSLSVCVRMDTLECGIQ